MLYGLAAFWGVAQVVSPKSGLIYIASALLFASVATSWAVLDSRINERKMPSSVPMLYFMLWPIASFIYFAWTRGWRGLGLWLIHAFGLGLIIMLTFYATVLLFYWAGVFDVAPEGTILTVE